MRKNRLCSLTFTLLVTVFVASTVFVVNTVFVANRVAACGDYGTRPKFENGVDVGGNFVGIDQKGHLVSTNLLWGGTRRYGSFERKLLPYLDVSNDRACVLTKSEICEVSLKTGKIIRTQKHDMGVCGIGIIDGDKVFLNSGLQVAIVDLKSGKTLHRIDLKSTVIKSKEIAAIRQVTHSQIDNFLYVARPFTKGVAVVDLKKGELVKEIVPEIRGWAQNVHANKDTVFIRQSSVSYGILVEDLILVDLKTNKQKHVGLGSEGKNWGWDGKPVSNSMIGTSEGGVILVVRGDVRRFDVNGKLVSEKEKLPSKEALELPISLMGMRRDHVLISDGGSVRALSLPVN